MMGLWADGWFYISSAGLLVSGVLFFFLLGQYRVASEAADATESELGADREASPVAAISPVYVPDSAPIAPVASHSDKPEAKAPEARPDLERRKDPANTTGGLSPAVGYLHNIKGELDDLHKDLRALAQRVNDELSAVSARDEALIDRLGELTRAIEELKAGTPAASAPPETPAAKKARKTEKATEPAPMPGPAPAPASLVLAPAPVSAPEPEPAAQPQPAPVRTNEETIHMELGALIAPPVQPESVSVPAEAPASTEPPPEEKPRRGPVWPV